MGAPKTPESIADGITQDILKGAYAPESRLPSIRALATTHGVNPATIQRAVARLEASGLVRARQGSGIVVNDPAATGDVSLLPAWMTALRGAPEQVVTMLADLLEMRRVIASRLLARNRNAILADSAALSALMGEMDQASGDVSTLLRADMAFTRRLLQASNAVVPLLLLNTLWRSLEQLPIIAQAMYAEPLENAASMAAVLTALNDGGDGLARTIEALIADIDGRTLQRLEELLRGQTGVSS